MKLWVRRTWEFVRLKLLLACDTSYLISGGRGIIATTLAVLGGVFLLVRIYDHFWSAEGSILSGTFMFWGIIAGSVFVAVLLRSPQLARSFKIKDKDVTVRLQIGNVIVRDADLVIATNTTFDTSFKNGFISKESVQGQLCLEEYDKVSALDRAINQELKGVSFVELNRDKSKSKQYPIGTVVKLSHEKRKSYWVALSDVNEFGKPNTDYENLFESLTALWRFIEEKGHLSDLAMPVFGSGRSGLVVPRTQIIKDIVMSFIHHTRHKKIVDSLTICVYPGDLSKHEIDLEELGKYIDYQCKFAFDVPDAQPTSTEVI